MLALHRRDAIRRVFCQGPEVTGMSEPIKWGTSFDRTLSFPLLVDELSAASLVFDVPLEAARALVPGTTFEVVETRPGVAQFLLHACDYRRTQWGTCHQLLFGFLARPAGEFGEPGGPVGTYVHRTPVDEAFTCAIGHDTMGYPISIELIEMRYTPDEVTVKLAVGVQPTLELRLPRKAAGSDPGDEPGAEAGEGSGWFETVAYSHHRGMPYEQPWEVDLSKAHQLDPAAVGLTIGTGPVADELRALGLPSAPVSGLWGENLSMRFHMSGPVGKGHTPAR